MAEDAPSGRYDAERPKDYAYKTKAVEDFRKAAQRQHGWTGQILEDAVAKSARGFPEDDDPGIRFTKGDPAAPPVPASPAGPGAPPPPMQAWQQQAASP